MATVNKSCLLHSKAANGDVLKLYPNTKIANVEGLQLALDGKVNTESGKGLSSNDYTTAEKDKLAGVAPGATANIGTVTQVKIGSTAYNPSSGVVGLPEYPTSLPASDVSAWAKASTKPSYTASEVGAAAKSHTHQYAGSSSAGGAANSAAKLTNTSKIGNTNKPVYFKADGTPAAINYTIDKSVPSNAVFTDTTYSAATQSASGLMSSTDKTKLDKYPSNLTLKCVYCNVSDSTQTCTYTISMTDFTGNVNTMSQCGTYIITRVSWSTTPTLSVYAVSYSGGIVRYNTITKIAGSDLTISTSNGNISITGSGKICIYALGSY